MTPSQILALFVANENDYRKFMRAPILHGDWIYSTNGHVAVRVPFQGGIEVQETTEIPKLQSLLDGSRRDSFVDIPQLPPPDKCYACGGRGYNYKCSDCGGEGEFEHERHEYTCKECDGSGQEDNGEPKDRIPCWKCEGACAAQQAVAVGPQHFDRRYLVKIFGLPGIKFSPNVEEIVSSGYFTFDGGEGMIMPMRA